MKYFSKQDCETLDSLRQAYKRLTKQFHPDCGGNASDFVAMKAEYEQIFKNLKTYSAFNATTDEERKEHNRKYDYKQDELFRDIIEKIIAFENITIEICGIWLWITGNTYPYREQFRSLGFSWSNPKKAWYWKPYAGNIHYKGGKSLDQIRAIYGSDKIETEQKPKLR